MGLLHPYLAGMHHQHYLILAISTSKQEVVFKFVVVIQHASEVHLLWGFLDLRELLRVHKQIMCTPSCRSQDTPWSNEQWGEPPHSHALSVQQDFAIGNLRPTLLQAQHFFRLPWRHGRATVHEEIPVYLPPLMFRWLYSSNRPLNFLFKYNLKL